MKGNKMEENKIKRENARLILGNLIKGAFMDGFIAAINMMNDQYKQVQEKGILEKIADNYEELWRKSIKNPAGEDANEVQNNN